MPNAATYQCPNCGGVASFDPSSGRVVCRSCGTALADDEVRTGIPLAEVPLAAREVEHARTAEDFLPRAPWELGVADVENTVSYSCPACAARIVADQSTVATSCPYCGNNLLVQGIVTPQNIPEQLLPFSVTREEAQERLRAHFGRAWYLPRSFTAEIAHIQSVYVPFYLYDLRVWGNAAYIMDESHDGDGRFRAVRLSGYAGFAAVAVDASSKMPDNHMDALGPFDLDGLRPFSAGYAAGHLMEVADEDDKTCGRRAEARVRSTFEAGLAHNAKRAHRGSGIDRTVDQETNCRVTSVGTCALPIWLIHCVWEGRQMLFAVNGTNGHCVGDLPVDRRRRALTVGVIAGATLAVLALVLVLFGSYLLDGTHGDGLLAVVGIALAAGGLVAIEVDQKNMAALHTAREAVGAGSDYDDEGLTITETWRAERVRSSPSAALRDL